MQHVIVSPDAHTQSHRVASPLSVPLVKASVRTVVQTYPLNVRLPLLPASEMEERAIRNLFLGHLDSDKLKEVNCNNPLTTEIS